MIMVMTKVTSDAEFIKKLSNTKAELKKCCLNKECRPI